MNGFRIGNDCGLNISLRLDENYSHRKDNLLIIGKSSKTKVPKTHEKR